MGNLSGKGAGLALRSEKVFESGLRYAQGCGNVTGVIGIETIGVEAMYQDLVLTVTF
jgi:hypothetical protein